MNFPILFPLTIDPLSTILVSEGDGHFSGPFDGQCRPHARWYGGKAPWMDAEKEVDAVVVGMIAVRFSDFDMAMWAFALHALENFKRGDDFIHDHSLRFSLVGCQRLERYGEISRS